MRRAICLEWAERLANNNSLDIVGASCVKDSDRKIEMEEDRLMEVWKAYYDVLMLW